MKKVTILGSTGSIGRSTLAVVDQFPDRLQVHALVCGNNQKLLAQQVRSYRPAIAAIANGEIGEQLKAACAEAGAELLLGPDAVEQVAGLKEADVVVAAMLGAAGLGPTLRAIAAGRRIALANKEVLVMAGELVLSLADKHGAEILPVDSEHNAIFQCLRGERVEELRRILLCASGGPFLGRDPDDFESITVSEALAHPRWKMGRKITIDSATLINKGLEMIEARWLFGLEPEQIDVVIHPQSVVHSMVEFVDGSIIAQIGRTDMMMPIQHCLSYPERWPIEVQRIEMHDVGRLDFQRPDRKVFRSLALADFALRNGGGYSTVLNAADEVAVEAFLGERISFPTIVDIVDAAMQAWQPRRVSSLDDVFEADKWSRSRAREEVLRRAQ